MRQVRHMRIQVNCLLSFVYVWNEKDRETAGGERGTRTSSAPVGSCLNELGRKGKTGAAHLGSNLERHFIRVYNFLNF